METTTTAFAHAAVEIFQATYVAITPARFPEKSGLGKEKNQLRQWKEVRVYDSDDLEQWLAMASPVACWLASTILPRPPSGVCDLGTRWKDIVGSLRRELPPAARPGGCAAAVDKISQWCMNSSMFGYHWAFAARGRRCLHRLGRITTRARAIVNCEPGGNSG